MSPPALGRACLFALLAVLLPLSAGAATLSVTDASGSSAIVAQPGATVDLLVRVESSEPDIAALEGVLDLRETTPSSAPAVDGVPVGGADPKARKVQAGPMFDDSTGTLLVMGTRPGPGRVEFTLAYMSAGGATAQGPGTALIIPVQVPSNAGVGATYRVKLTGVTLKDSRNTDLPVSVVEASLQVGDAGPPSPPPSGDSAPAVTVVTDAAGSADIRAEAGQWVNLVVRVDASVRDFGAAEFVLDFRQKTPAGAADVTGKAAGSDAGPPEGRGLVTAELGAIFQKDTADFAVAMANQLEPGRIKAVVAYINRMAPANGPGPIAVIPVMVPAGVAAGTVYTLRLQEVALQQADTTPIVTEVGTATLTVGAPLPPPVGSVTLGSAAGAPGAAVLVPVSIGGFTVTGGELRIDASKAPPGAPALQVLGVETGATLLSGVGGSAAVSTGTPGLAVVTLTNPTQAPIRGPGVLFHLKVGVSPQAITGTVYPLALASAQLVNGGSALSVTTVAGALTVSEADETAPTVSIKSPADTSLAAGDVAIEVEAVDASGVAKVEVSVAEGGYSESLTSPPWRFTLRKGTLPDGVYTLVAKATDAVGNTATSKAVVITLDTTGPKLEVAGVAEGDALAGTRDLKVSASDSAAGVAKVALFVDDAAAPVGELTAPGSDGKFSFSLDTRSLSEGAHTLKLSAADKLQNQSTLLLEVTVDNTAPTATLASPKAKDVVRGVVEVRGTASDGAEQSSFDSYVLEVGEGAGPTTYTEVAKGTEPVTDGVLGQWNASKLEPGDYTLRLTARDRAGNSVQTSVIVTVRNLLMGDLDGNGAISVIDVVHLLRIVAGLNPNPAPDQRAVSDVDGNGRVDVRDVVLLLRRVAGLEP